jgi:hypothetical protein
MAGRKTNAMPDPAPFDPSFAGGLWVRPLQEVERRHEGEVARFDARWPDKNGAWNLSGSVAATAGRLVISRMSLEPRDEVPTSGLTTPVARVPLGALLNRVSSLIRGAPAMVKEWERQVGPVSTPMKDAIAKAIDAPGPERRRGNRDLGDDHYREIAREYLELLDEGVTKGILKRIADAHHVAPERARDWVREARNRHFLSAGTPGSAGALPGSALDP